MIAATWAAAPALHVEWVQSEFATDGLNHRVMTQMKPIAHNAEEAAAGQAKSAAAAITLHPNLT